MQEPLNPTEHVDTHLERLFRASSLLFAVNSPLEAMQAITQSARENLGAWYVVVALIGQDGQLHVQYIDGIPEPIDTFRQARPNGISMDVFKSGSPRYMDDLNLVSNVSQKLIEDGVRAAACLPLTLQGNVIGVIWIHYQQMHVFNESEKLALSIYANHAAIAYDNAQRLHQMTLLTEAVKVLSDTEGEEASLHNIAQVAKSLLKADYIFIYPYDALSVSFVLDKAVALGVPDEFKVAPRGKIGRSVLSQHYLDEYDIQNATPERIEDLNMDYLNAIRVRAYQGIALNYEGESLGVLFADYLKPKRFMPADVDLFTQFANFAAATLRQAKRAELVRRGWESIQTIAEAIASNQLVDTLQAIATKGQWAMQCSITSIYAYDPEIDRVTTFDVKGANATQPDNVVSWFINQDSSECIANSPPHPLLDGEFVQREDIRSCLAIKLLNVTKCVGAIFFNFKHSHVFSVEEMELARRFANLAAVAVQSDQLRNQREKQQRIIEANREADAELLVDQPLDVLAERYCSLALAAVGLTDRPNAFSHIALLDQELNRLWFIAASQKDVLDALQHNERFGIDLNEPLVRPIGISGLAVKTGRIQNISNIEQYPDYYIELRTTTRSQLSVPLIYAGQVLGVISIEDTGETDFTESDVIAVDALAATLSVAVAIARSNLFADLAKGQKEATLIALEKITEASINGDLHVILETILQEAHFAFPFDIATLYAFRDSKKSGDRRIIDVARYGYTGYDIDAFSELSDESTRLHIWKLGPPYHLRDEHLLETRQAKAHGIKSAIGLQLRFGEKRIGVLMIGYKVKHPWGEKEISDIQRFGQLAAAVIFEFYLRQQSSRQVNALGALHEAARAVVRHASHQETVERIVQQAMQLFVTNQILKDGRRIRLISHLAIKKGDVLEYFTSDPRLLQVKQRINLKTDAPIGISGRVVLTGRSENVPNVAIDPDYIAYDNGICSQLSVPLVSGEEHKVIGVLSVESTEPNAFTNDDENLLRSLVYQAVVGLENADLHEQLEGMQAIAKVGLLGSIKDIVESVVSEVFKRMRCNSAILYPYDEAIQRFLAPVCVGVDDRVLKSAKQQSSSGSKLQSIMMSEEGFTRLEGEEIAHCLFEHTQDLHSMTSALAVALRCQEDDSEQRRAGVLILGHSTETSYMFSDGEVECAKNLAQVAAISIISAQRYIQIRKLGNNRQASLALAGMTLTTDTWLHGLYNRIASVDQFLNAARNYLKTVPVNANLIAKQLEEMGRVFDTIREGVRLPPDQSRKPHESLDLRDILSKQIESWRTLDKYAHLLFEMKDTLGESLKVEGDPRQIGKAIEIIVDNAAKATKALERNRRRVILSLHTESNEWVKIGIRDFGPGIPVDIMTQLKSRRPISALGKSEGWGYGLIMAYFIAQLHDGDIDFENHSPYGASVTIQLPILNNEPFPTQL